MKNSRYEFFILTLTIFLTGAVIYGLVGLGAGLAGSDVWGIKNPILLCMFAGLGGGYFFFSILSGVLFTSNWLSHRTLKGKMLLTVFFIVPVWLSLAGIFYSIPYGIYNFVKYRKTCEET